MRDVVLVMTCLLAIVIPLYYMRKFGLSKRVAASRPLSAAQGAPAGIRISPDGSWWWDGERWVSSNASAPPGALWSSDDAQWCDGLAWHVVAKDGRPALGGIAPQIAGEAAPNRRHPPALEGDAPMRIEDIRVFRTIPGVPFRTVHQVEGSATSRTAFDAPPTTEAVDMRLREAAAAVGANAVVDPVYARGSMSWRWHPLVAFATAVVVDPLDLGTADGAAPQPVFSPDRGQWWDGSTWIGASRSSPASAAVWHDGTGCGDGPSRGPRPLEPRAGPP